MVIVYIFGCKHISMHVHVHTKARLYVSMIVLVYACTHICIHVCACMYKCSYVRACIHICVHGCVYVCTYCALVCVCMHACTSVSMCVYTCIKVCESLFACVYGESKCFHGYRQNVFSVRRAGLCLTKRCLDIVLFQALRCLNIVIRFIQPLPYFVKKITHFCPILGTKSNNCLFLVLEQAAL